MVNPSLVKILEAADQLSEQLVRNRALFEKVIQKAQAVKVFFFFLFNNFSTKKRKKKKKESKKKN